MMRLHSKLVATAVLSLMLFGGAVGGAQAMPYGGGDTVRGVLSHVCYCLDMLFNDTAVYEAECQPGPGPVDFPERKRGKVDNCQGGDIYCVDR